MNENQTILDKLSQMENSIVSRLEQSMEDKINKLTDQALQKIHQDVKANSNTLSEINEEVDTIKTNVINNTDNLVRIDETVRDNLLRIMAQEKVNNINEQRLQSIKKEMDDKHYQMSFADKRKIRERNT